MAEKHDREHILTADELTTQAAHEVISLSEQRLADILADLEAVPLPPWRWVGTIDAGGPRLVTAHSGQQSLLYAARPADQHGEEATDVDGGPVYGDLKFRSQRDGEQYATMRTGAELAVPRAAYDPDTIADIDSPVARWIKRSPVYVAELLGEVERLRQEVARLTGRHDAGVTAITDPCQTQAGRPLTEQQLDDMLDRANQAENGWHLVPDKDDPFRFEIHGDGPTHVAVFGGDPEDSSASYDSEANARFAVHARWDVTALVMEVRRLRADEPNGGHRHG